MEHLDLNTNQPLPLSKGRFFEHPFFGSKFRLFKTSSHFFIPIIDLGDLIYYDCLTRKEFYELCLLN